jgi:hypothetical protein
MLGQAPAGIQIFFKKLGSRFHGKDGYTMEKTVSAT